MLTSISKSITVITSAILMEQWGSVSNTYKRICFVDTPSNLLTKKKQPVKFTEANIFDSSGHITLDKNPILLASLLTWAILTTHFRSYFVPMVNVSYSGGCTN